MPCCMMHAPMTHAHAALGIPRWARQSAVPSHANHAMNRVQLQVPSRRQPGVVHTLTGRLPLSSFLQDGDPPAEGAAPGAAAGERHYIDVFDGGRIMSRCCRCMARSTGCLALQQHFGFGFGLY